MRDSALACAGWLAGLGGWRRLVAAFLLGAVAVLAMPPGHMAPLLLIAFPGLLWLLTRAQRFWPAFWVGWAFGFGFFTTGLYWVGVALTVDFARFFWLMPFAVAGLPAMLAIFIGLVTGTLARLPVTGVARVLAFAALWGAAEWLRGTVLTGFPWNLIGYGWAGWSWMLQSAALWGIYGLSMITVAVAALPAAWVRADTRSLSPGGGGAFLAGLAILLAIAAGGAVRLIDAPAVAQAVQPEVRLRLVQPNISQIDKWRDDLYVEHFRRHLEMSAEQRRDPVTHIVWPETAVPWLLNREEGVRQAIGSVTPEGGLTIVGAPRGVDAGEPTQYWNSLFAIDPDGEIVASYDKFHLVPFGEYVPLRGLLPIDKITPGQVDFSAGPGPRTLTLPGLPPVSPLICYEAIFPGRVTASPADGPRPDWLLNLTNDAWYGITAGPYQHFAIAMSRAVEEGLPMVRVATTGISGVVDPYGRVVGYLGLDEPGVVDSPLPLPLQAPPPYARWNNIIPLFIFLLLILGATLAMRRPSLR